MEIGGKNISNWWIIGGGAAAVVVYYVYKNAKNNSSAESSGTSESASSIDPVTGLPYSEDNQVDPATGMTYLQEAEEYGSVQAAEQEVTSGSAYYGDTGSGAVDSGYPTYYPESYGTSTPSATSYSTNAQWAQAVTSGLVALGYSSTDVTTALGLFFAQHPLGSGSDGVSYASIIEAAEAEYGSPPQGTYQIIPEPSTSTTPPGGSGTLVTVPDVVGKRQQDAVEAIQAAGLKSSTGPGFIQDQINIVESQTPGAGKRVAAGSTVDIGDFKH